MLQTFTDMVGPEFGIYVGDQGSGYHNGEVVWGRITDAKSQTFAKNLEWRKMYVPKGDYLRNEMELTRGGAGSEVLNDLSDSLTKAEYFAQQIYVEEIEFQLVKVE